MCVTVCVFACGAELRGKHGRHEPQTYTVAPLKHDRSKSVPSGLQSHPVRRVYEDTVLMVRREHEQLKELGGQVCAS